MNSKQIPSLLLDSVIAIFIGLPFLIGGFGAIHSLGISTLIVSLLIYAGDRYKKIALDETVSYRWCQRFWSVWKAHLNQRPDRTLFFGVVFFTFLLSLSSLRRHWAFQSGAFDLGIYTNYLWNLSHSFDFSSLKGEQTLQADHFQPIFYLITWFGRFKKLPELLLILQALGITLGAVPLYVLAKQYFKNKTHWVFYSLPLLYWFYLPFRNGNRFDFHPESLAPFFVLSTIAAFQSQKVGPRVLGILFLILSLTLKESLGGTFVGIGLVWLFLGGPKDLNQSYQRFLGMSMITIGFLSFYYTTQIFPRRFETPYFYASAYSDFGTNFFDILLAPIQKPFLFFERMFGVSRLKFLYFLFAPIGFLAVFSPLQLLASLPSIAMLFLGAGDLRLGTGFHYGFEPSIGILWALTALGSKKLNLKPIFLIFFFLLSFDRSEFYYMRSYTPTPHMNWIQNELIPCLSPESKLAATHAVLPHFANRKWIQLLSKNTQADCLIFDSSLNNWGGIPESSLSRFQKLYSCKSTQIYSNGAPFTSCMACQPQCVD